MIHVERMLRPLARRHAPFIAVALIALLFAACGTVVPTATEVPTIGVLEGRVLGAGGRPLRAMDGVVARVGGDGSYRIPLVRPGEHGLILVYAVRAGYIQ